MIPRILNSFESVLSARMCLLKTRFADSSETAPQLLRPFDRTVLESVLFHTLRLGMRRPISSISGIDDAFWSTAERILTTNRCFDAQPTDVLRSSPVFGMYLPLGRIMHNLTRYSRYPTHSQGGMYAWLMAGSDFCKSLLLGCRAEPEPNHHLHHSKGTELYEDMSAACDDAALLCFLTTSLLPLISTTTAAATEITFTSRRVSLRACWQVQMALDVLRKAALNPEWPRCFTASLAVHLLGYCVHDIDDKNLVTHDLQSRWVSSSCWEYKRMLRNLEAFWGG